MEYIHHEFNTKKLGLSQPMIRLYPFVCMHLGAAQCDMKFIKEGVDRLRKDPNGIGVYMGDGGECVTKLSKGDVYAQLCSPQQQHDILVKVLEPVKKKLLFGIRGNHGHRVYKETGLDFDKNLCHRLGIPYMGASAFLNITVNRSSYDCFFHHGTDSGVAMQSKVNKAESFKQFIDADALFTAHSHACIDVPPAALMFCNNGSKRVKTKLRYQYICGCAYDSRSGYAEDKGYPPILPAWLRVTFDGRIIEGQAKRTQKCEIFRSDGQHKLTHEYISKGGE